MTENDRTALPATIEDRPHSSRMAADVRLPEPGTWWRVTRLGEVPTTADEQFRSTWENAAKSAEDILATEWLDGVNEPSHGVVLLLTDARYVDGELHSLVLAPHPGWQGKWGRRPSSVKLILGEFDLMMVEEPDGAALRASEEASLMGFIGQLTNEMARPPAPGEIAAIIAKKEEAEAEELARQRSRMIGHRQEADGRPAPAEEPAAPEVTMARMSSLVPAALLPSRDLQQAEVAVKHQLRLAEANREIIEGRVNRVKKGMETVAFFQEEKVATAMAGMSRQRKFAEDMLSSVHTMKLWLGEGVELYQMREGAGAPAGTAVHFMQQLLFLDEEIFVQDMLGEGFSSDHFGSLQSLLQNNPEMVERMLPYERSVCITRVRRKEREFEVPGDWGGIMEVVGKKQADRMIQIFVRDGDRLTMISADEETSRAPRLFPSKSEIDGIFKSNVYGDRSRVIDVTDVQYADRRQDHDRTALFYKRLLLILWGAHEREDVLGEFPKGLNWLTGTVHDDHFRFIHDEEMGLHVDRKPILDWIGDHNRRIRPGSQVVATWGSIYSRERAPGAWSNPTHRDREQIRYPKNKMDLVTVLRSGNALQVPCVSSAHNWRDEGKDYNVNVRIQSDASRTETLAERGVICIDHMRSADMRAYIDSRWERRSYLHWLGEFKAALPVVEKRERLEEVLVNRIMAGSPHLDARVIAQLPVVAHEAVLAAGFILPGADRDEKLVQQAARIAEGVTVEPADLKVVVRPGGDILRMREIPSVTGGAAHEPFWLQQTCSVKADGSLRVRSERIVAASPLADPGDIVIHEPGAPEPRTAAIGINSVADREALLQVTQEDADLIQHLDAILNPTEDDVRGWVQELRQVNLSARHVMNPPIDFPVGIAVVPPTGDPYGMDRGKLPTLHLLSVRLHRLEHAWLAGQRDIAATFSRIYAKPQKFLEAMDKATGPGARPTVEIGLTYAVGKSGLKDLARSDEFLAQTVRIGCSQIELKSYTPFGQDRSYVHVPEDASLGEAVRRAVVESRGSSLVQMDGDKRTAWLEGMNDIRIFLAPGIEERLVKIMLMFDRPAYPEATPDPEATPEPE